MSDDEIEDFSSDMKVRLIADDYAILRAYQHRSSFETYIIAVAARLLLDYRNRLWGRWYDSAIATHLGPVAVELERLLYRDERPFEDAVAMVRARHPDLTREEVEDLAAKLQPRIRRRNVELNEDEQIVAREMLLPFEYEKTADRISKSVCDFVDMLPETDRCIIRLRFDAEMPVSQIARSLGVEEVMVYRKLYRLFKDIRAKLEAEGFDAAAVEELIGNDAAPLDFHLRGNGEELLISQEKWKERA
jgi:RNA polymerase sigma factor (sigma-70 family)